MPNPATETLMLAFAGDAAFAEPARALFLRAEPHRALKSWSDEVTGWQPHRPKTTGWEEAGFSRCDEPEGQWPLVMQLPGKSKEEVLSGFYQAWERLEPGGQFVAAMSNKEGAARFEKELRKVVGHVESIQKNKCRVFGARKTEEAPAHLPDTWREMGERRKIPDTAYVTEAGIFSAKKIDPGSAMLAEAVPAKLRGKVADLGAGWGYLSDVILKKCEGVKRLDLYEADARALDCARINLAAHADRNVGFHWHDVTKGLAERYDALVMNPPFHDGRAQDVLLGRAFLKTAGESLFPGGELWMVANRHLPYEEVLNDCGFQWCQIGCDATYKVIHGTK